MHTMAGTQLVVRGQNQGPEQRGYREGTCLADLEDFGEEVWSFRGGDFGHTNRLTRIRPISGSGEVAR